MYQQKFHLYRNLTKPSERLYLSFAKAGASGEAQNPSYLINEIRKLFPEIPVRDIEKEENTPSGTDGTGDDGGGSQDAKDNVRTPEGSLGNDGGDLSLIHI